MGVLRRQLWLDRLIEHYANRKIASLDESVRIALRLGLFQLRFLTRVPASAAVNESVNLVHFARVRSAGSFVNAVLRRATREPELAKHRLWAANPRVVAAPAAPRLPDFKSRRFSSHAEMNAWKKSVRVQLAQLARAHE